MVVMETGIAICGHAKHGKSTLAGRLLCDLGGMKPDELARRWSRARIEVEDFGKYEKDFNPYSYMFLERRPDTYRKGTSERDDPSRTVVPTRGSVSLDGRRLTLVDEPGYSRYLGNIVYGIYLSDLGLLVVEAKAGVCSGTTLNARLLAFFDIPILAVCITKMDEVGFSRDAFEEVSKAVTDLIAPLVGDPQPPVIPVFALTDAPTMAAEPRLAWYTGQGLATVLDKTSASHVHRLPGAARLAVKEVYAPPGVGTVLVGVLESGSVHVDDRLVIEPASTLAQKSIEIRCRSLQRARSVNEPRLDNVAEIDARAIASVATGDLSRSDAERYTRHGAMLGPPGARPTVATRIRATVAFFRANAVYKGKRYVVQANAATATANVLSVARGQDEQRVLLKDAPFAGPEGEILEVDLAFGRPMCLETDVSFGRLTRFVMYENSEIVACGRCLEVLG